MKTKASLPLLRRAVFCLAFMCAWPCRAIGGARSADSQPAISFEDLQDALDRGDLAQWEFDLLVPLVLERQRADSAELALLSKNVARTPFPGSPPRPSGPRGSARLGLYAPLRGSGTSAQELQLLPALRGFSAQVYARRTASRPWYVTRATVGARRGAVEFEAGSIDLVWTGGLLVGSSPLLSHEIVSGPAGLWRPSADRLHGARARVTAGRVDLEAFASAVSDSLWRHRAAGARWKITAGRTFVEPAVLTQELTSRPQVLSHTLTGFGLATGSSLSSVSVQLEAAALGGTEAFQGQASGRILPARWSLEYWNVSPGFRNPLLHARGETDREWIHYAELDADIASASTGESGGRVTFRSGGSRTYGELSSTLWREHPFRPAAVRVQAVAQQTRGTRVVRLEYLHTTRPGEDAFDRRHEAGMLGRRGNVFGELRGKLTSDAGALRTTVGGRLAAGVRLQSVALGQWEARAAWDSYDLSLASGQFVTLRVDHSLPLGHGQLAVHLRWRSAYATHAAALSLRIDSSVYL